MNRNQFKYEIMFNFFPFFFLHFFIHWFEFDFEIALPEAPHSSSEIQKESGLDVGAVMLILSFLVWKQHEESGYLANLHFMCTDVYLL